MTIRHTLQNRTPDRGRLGHRHLLVRLLLLLFTLCGAAETVWAVDYTYVMLGKADGSGKRPITAKFKNTNGGALGNQQQSLLVTAHHYWKAAAGTDNGDSKQIVASLARQLQQEYGNNFSEKNLRRMMQFAVRFPDKEKVVSLIRQLTWTHVIALIPIEDDLKRDCKRQ